MKSKSTNGGLSVIDSVDTIPSASGFRAGSAPGTPVKSDRTRAGGGGGERKDGGNSGAP